MVRSSALVLWNPWLSLDSLGNAESNGMIIAPLLSKCSCLHPEWRPRTPASECKSPRGDMSNTSTDCARWVYYQLERAADLPLDIAISIHQLRRRIYCPLFQWSYPFPVRPNRSRICVA